MAAFNKPKFLELLAEGYNASQACREMGVRAGAYTYHTKKNPEFREQVALLLKRRKQYGSVTPKSDATWQEKFLERYAECNDRIDAAQYAGIRPTDLRDALSPENPSYDEEFRRKFDDIDMEQTWKIMDGIRRDASADDAAMSVRKAALDMSKTEMGRKADSGVSISATGEAGALEWLKSWAKEDQRESVH